VGGGWGENFPGEYKIESGKITYTLLINMNRIREEEREDIEKRR
jgi:hypothetical protein